MSAQIAQSHCREPDVLARHGGEEFIVLATDRNADDARRLAERMRNAFEQADIAAADGSVFHVTASFGVVTSPANNVGNME